VLVARTLILLSGAVFEAPRLVAGSHNFAVAGKAIKQRRGHFGVTKDAWPFAEGEVAGDCLASTRMEQFSVIA
jgi:hypothetical protein